MSAITAYEVSEKFKDALVRGEADAYLYTDVGGKRRILWDKVSLRCVGNKIYAKFKYSSYAYIDAEIDAVDICDGGEVTIDLSGTEVSIR